ncbi:MAG TPA: protease pro-enzyme activation domain-containing protein [Mycobacteriales bacterium]|nr:protease pro-enzyme activation domain-containing protein [Mycobacteriales bacterium]
MNVRRTAVSLACLSVLGTSVSIANATATSQAIHLVRTKAVLPGLAHATRLGAARPGTELTVGLGLAHPNPGLEDQLYKQLYRPASPLYRHFLSPQQYDATFGVPASTERAAAAWLRSGGLKIETVSGARDYLTATGTVAQVGKLMHTHFGSYRVGTLHFLANDIAPEVPASLPVNAVLGLNTLQRMWTAADVARVNAANGIPTSLGAQPHAKVKKGPYTGLLYPRNLWGVYNEPKSNEGQGQSAGLFMEGYTNSVIANMRLFEQHNKLPQVPVRVVKAGGKGTPAQYGDNLDAIEWYLDSDAITGMAPKLRELDLYTTKALFDASIAAAFATWVNDPKGPKQMNASFGECETSPANPVLGPLAQPPFYYGTEAGDELEPVAEPILQQANLEGRTLFASTGDTGGSCPVVVVPVVGAGNGLTPQPVPEQNYPAASPHVTGVDGTTVTTTTQAPRMVATHRDSEVGWTYSGGGSSFWISEPDYQKGLAAIDQPCVVDPAGSPYTPGTICRGVGDIADMSGTVQSYQSGSLLAENLYEIESDMADSSEGGTSLSSPLAVGMWSRIQAAAPSRKGLGFANETFYRVGKSATYHRDFTDITKSETAGGNFYYRAGAGWDYVTGWGAMNVKNLMRDVDHRLTPSFPTAQRKLPLKLNGCVAFTSPAGNANNPLYPGTTDPGMDITGAGLRVSGRTLIATISGQNLSVTPPLGATGGKSFFMLWTAGKTTYFGSATVTEQGNVSYAAGISKTSYNAKHTIQGSFRSGTVTLRIPLADVGNPKPGTILAYPYAESEYNLSGATPATNPLAFTEDVATAGQPGQGLKIGARCRA